MSSSFWTARALPRSLRTKESTLNIAVCYGLAYGLAKPLVRLIFSGLSKKWAENLAMLAGMGLFVVFNYFGQRFFAFREKKAE